MSKQFTEMNFMAYDHIKAHVKTGKFNQIMLINIKQFSLIKGNTHSLTWTPLLPTF